MTSVLSDDRQGQAPKARSLAGSSHVGGGPVDSTKPIVELKNVTKVFKTAHGQQKALNDVSFAVGSGEVVCLIGPSGSGKSTCLRTINALETISAGSVEVCGFNYATSNTSLHEIRRNTAMIFQRFELFPHLTALENVELGLLQVLGRTKTQARQEGLSLLAEVGLADHAQKFPKMLSGGQQQRVAIARALALRPRVLLCDEPTSALDPELVDEVLEILLRIARTGVTMLVVTHELQFAQNVSNRCLFFDHGSLVEQGRTKSLFSAPKTPRLQQFLSKLRHTGLS